VAISGDRAADGYHPAMARGFQVIDATTRKEIGRAEFDGESWTFTGASAREMVEPLLANGWTNEQVLIWYNGHADGVMWTVTL
jgi:hypothetical protein